MAFALAALAAARAEDALTAAEAALSAAYDARFAQLDPEGKQALAGDQQSWRQWRDRMCRGLVPEHQQCLLARDRERAEMLRATPQYEGAGAPRFRLQFFRHVEESKGIDISISWPVALEPAPTGLNEALAAFGAHVVPNGSLDLKRSPRIVYASARLISIRFQYRVGWDEGHGYGGAENFNFLLEAGRRLEISDLVDGPSLTRLKDYCRDRLSAEIRARQIMSDAAAVPPSFDLIGSPLISMDAWSFDRGGASIDYEPGLVSRRGEGSYQCTIPWATLRSLLKPDAPLPFE